MNVITSTHVSRHYWWGMGLRGLLAVLFGLAAIFLPIQTLFVLVLFFGAYVLVDGVIAVIVSLQERSTNDRWWVLLLEGLAGILAGLLAFVFTPIAALVLLYVIAVWAIVTGAFEIAISFSGWLPLALEWTLALAGILSVVLGVLLVTRPAAGLLSLVWVIGVYAIVFGLLLIIRAFQFRTAVAT